MHNMKYTDETAHHPEPDSTRRLTLNAGLTTLLTLLGGCGPSARPHAADEPRAGTPTHPPHTTDVAAPLILGVSKTPLATENNGRAKKYFVEVVSSCLRESRVSIGYQSDLALPVLTQTTLAYRERGRGTADSVNYATIDLASPWIAADAAEQGLTEWDRRVKFIDSLMLNVSITDSPPVGPANTIFFLVGKQHGGATAQVMHRYFNDAEKEDEWLFAYSGAATADNWDVAVRFFQNLDTVESATAKLPFPIGEITLDEPFHDSEKFSVKTFPKAGTYLPEEDPAYAAGVHLPLGDVAEESISLPMHRHTNRWEIVRPLLQKHSSEHAANHTKRRLLRHVSRFTAYVRETSTKYSADHWGGRIQSELLKVICGGDVVANMGADVDAFLARAKNAVNDTVTGFEDALSNIGGQYDTDARALQKESTPETPDTGSTMNVAVLAHTNTVSAQLKVTWLPLVEEEMDIATGALLPKLIPQAAYGIRLSMPIMKYSKARTILKHPTVLRTTSDYRMKDHATKGTKLVITFLIDFDKASSVGPKGLFDQSFALEISLSLSFKRNATTGKLQCRVDGVVFDPVWDLRADNKPNRERVLAVVNKAVSLLARGTTKLEAWQASMEAWVVDTLPAPALTFIGNIVKPITTVIRPVGSAASYLTTAFVNGMAAAAKQLEDSLGIEAQHKTHVEVSILRVAFINPDLAEQAVVGFRPGWQGGLTVAYVPGYKFLNQVGFYRTPSVVLPFGGFLRIIDNYDRFLMFGNRTKLIGLATIIGGTGGG